MPAGLNVLIGVTGLGLPSEQRAHGRQQFARFPRLVEDSGGILFVEGFLHRRIMGRLDPQS